MPKRRADLEREELSSAEAVDQISRHSRKLAELTRQAAQALGAYEGGNTAVRESTRCSYPWKRSSCCTPPRERLWQRCAFALFDSDKRVVSYQRINRSLKRADVREELFKRSRPMA